MKGFTLSAIYRTFPSAVVILGLLLGFSGGSGGVAASSTPDLVIDSITWHPAEPLIGDRMTFTVTVSNQGQAASGLFNLAYYVDDIYIIRDEIDGLAPGAAASRTFAWTAQAGQHTVRAVADYQNAIPEGNEGNNERASTFSTLGSDLIIKSITWSPAQPAIGDTVTFAITAKNQGSINAGSTRVYFYIDDASRGYQNIDKVDAGAEVTRTFTWYMKAGPHTLTATVDEENQITEMDETNNQTTVPFSLLLPDLAIEDMTWSPEKPSIGDNVTFSVNITNQGIGESGLVEVNFYVDEHYHSTNATDSIAAGNSGNVTFIWKTVTGTHSFKVAASVLHAPESNLANNVKTATFSTVLSDLIVPNITWSPEAPALGDNITFTIAVKNQGEGSSKSCRVYLLIDGYEKGYKVLEPLSANSSATLTFDWQVEAGGHFVRAVADALSEVPETNEDNNQKTVSLSTTPTDLIVEEITWSPAYPDIGDTVTFTVGIKNQGEAPADYSYVSYYVDGALLETGYVGIIAANTTANETFTWTAQAGEHYIKAIADVNTRVVESDETNNEKTCTMPSIGPDLTIARLTWSLNDPSVGDRVTFIATIKNRGHNSAGISQVYFYVDDASAGYQEVPQIDAGAELTASFEWVVQPDAHAVRAIADSSDTVRESDEANNEALIAYPMPDLAIAAMDRSVENPVAGETVTFTIQVANQGSRKADSSLLDIYIDDVLAEQQDMPEIEAGGMVVRTFTWRALAGSHDVSALADGTNSVTEGEENNNRETVALAIPAPDLIIEDITWSPTGPLTSDDLVTVTITIRNQGNVIAKSFYLSCYINGEYLTSGSVNPLRPNAAARKTLNLLIGEAGSHAAKIVLDEEDLIPESDETNNVRTVTLPIPASAVSAEPETTPETKSPARPQVTPIPLDQPEEGYSMKLLFFLPALIIGGILIFALVRSRRKT